ncbi:MAG TPA: 30S ribosomal protein S2 [Candidatus Omnitrophota bacterium]|nr:30S ribosomal protein S2 [Candidatus Omnitrophota bacterium]
MPDEILRTLLECGVHFGHQTRRWNPKMKRFIFGERSGIYIIDLEKTKEQLAIAQDFVHSVAAKGGSVLFVGTKKQAKDVLGQIAQKAGMPYINNRWMGGLLTNFETVRKSLEKLCKIEKMEEDGMMENLKKKEVSRLNKEKGKLLRDLGGIREMHQLPQAVFVVDSKREEISIREANRLHIPVVALIDTNSDPDFIDFPIPGNDDALKSIRYIATMIADAIIAGQKEYAEAREVQKKIDITAEEPPEAPASPEEVPAVSNDLMSIVEEGDEEDEDEQALG